MTDYKLMPKSIVDELAQFIRQVGGNNKMGAGSLAEKICERFHVADPAVQGEPVGYVSPRLLDALRSGKACGITMEDKSDAHNGVTIPLYTAPQPADQQPDATQLVEALTELCDEIDKHEIHTAISKTSISWFKRKARAVLATHRKGDE